MKNIANAELMKYVIGVVGRRSFYEEVMQKMRESNKDNAEALEEICSLEKSIEGTEAIDWKDKQEIEYKQMMIDLNPNDYDCNGDYVGV